MTVTADKQVEFDGLALEGAYQIQKIEGLADMPDVRTADLTIAGRHGARGGTDLLDARNVVITLDIYAWDPTTFAAAVQTLREAFQIREAGEGVLAFQLHGIADGQPARLFCRPRRLALPLEPAYWHDWVTAIVELWAGDPVIYSDVEYGGATVLPEASDGLEFDVVFPIEFGDVGSGGVIFATNDGSWPADVVVRIDGPVTDPRVENVTTGQVLEFDIDLAAGEYLILDSRARTVMLNGTASRYSTLTDESRWWRLQPGPNEITFRAATATAATMSLTWRSSWI